MTCTACGAENAPERPFLEDDGGNHPSVCDDCMHTVHGALSYREGPGIEGDEDEDD